MKEMGVGILGIGMIWTVSIISLKVVTSFTFLRLGENTRGIGRIALAKVALIA